MSTPTIKLEETQKGGQYVYRNAEQPPAILAFQRKGSVLLMDETKVPPSYRGQGVAFKLVERSIADARENGWKIQPACSYVVAQFAKHPEWADVLAE
jgi:predicted GNAT family acetyltransferase